MTTKRNPRRSSLACSVVILLGQLALGCSGEGPVTSNLDPEASLGAVPLQPGEHPSGQLPGQEQTGSVTAPGQVPGVAPGGAGGSAPPDGSGMVDGTNSNPPGSTPAGSNAPPPDEPSAGYIRRLTHVELDATLTDLLGIEVRPSDQLASDVALQGFTNNAAGQNVTPTLAEQYIAVAEDVSRLASANLPALLKCDLTVTAEADCIQQFVVDFGSRAWRRPLTSEEQARALELFNSVRGQYELDVSVQLLVQFFLLSPHFLYLVEPLPEGAAPGSIVPLDAWRVASRLSYFLLGSMPDEALMAAAESGALETAQGVAEQAERLLTLPRARERIGLFFTEWLRLRHADKLQKDSALFPDFDLSMGPLMREQVERFAQAVILDDGGTAIDLLTAPFTFVNERLAPLYGVAAPSGSTMVRVELDPNQRAGLLTHAALLATLAHQNQTDPVVRGKFVRESLLCSPVPPPPADLVIAAPEITPGSTTRERFRQHQESPACSGCHALMDPIGLGFENYDPIGQWRDLDNGIEVDATGEIIGTDVAGTFEGAIELAQKLAGSAEVMNCFAKTWMRFALGRSEQDADAGALAAVGERFEATGYKMSELLVALTETQAFRYQRVLDPNTSALPDVSVTPTEDEVQ